MTSDPSTFDLLVLCAQRKFSIFGTARDLLGICFCAREASARPRVVLFSIISQLPCRHACIVVDALQAQSIVSFEAFGKRMTGRILEIHRDMATIDCNGKEVHMKLSSLSGGYSSPRETAEHTGIIVR